MVDLPTPPFKLITQTVTGPFFVAICLSSVCPHNSLFPTRAAMPLECHTGQSEAKPEISS
jgi:hypothetical protein